MISLIRNPMFLVVSFIYVMLIASGVVQFHLWSQVEVLRGENPFVLVGHPHFFRYLLVFPLYELSDVTGVSSDYIFSLVCGVMIVGIAVNISYVYKRIDGSYLSIMSLFSLNMYILLSVFMHGRIIFALFSMSILLLMITELNSGKSYSLLGMIVRLVCIFMLASVSSGTLSVVFIFLMVWLSQLQVKMLAHQGVISKASRNLSVLLLILLISVLPVMLVLLNKNISYYGGFSAMLHHGAGAVLLTVPLGTLVLSALLLVSLGGLAILGFVFFKRERPIILAFCVSLLGGAFGFSTMVMGVPAMGIFGMLGLSSFLILLEQGKSEMIHR